MHPSIEPAEVVYREVVRADPNGNRLEKGTACVAAYVGAGPDAECVGALFFDCYGEPSVVIDVSVEEAYRRQGIGTGLFNFARSRQSDLVHSETLTSDGRAFVQSFA